MLPPPLTPGIMGGGAQRCCVVSTVLPIKKLGGCRQATMSRPLGNSWSSACLPRSPPPAAQAAPAPRLPACTATTRAAAQQPHQLVGLRSRQPNSACPLTGRAAQALMPPPPLHAQPQQGQQHDPAQDGSAGHCQLECLRGQAGPGQVPAQLQPAAAGEGHVWGGAHRAGVG